MNAPAPVAQVTDSLVAPVVNLLYGPNTSLSYPRKLITVGMNYLLYKTPCFKFLEWKKRNH